MPIAPRARLDFDQNGGATINDDGGADDLADLEATMGRELRLTLACGDYEIVRALEEATVKADGLELIFHIGMESREFAATGLVLLGGDSCG